MKNLNENKIPPLPRRKSTLPSPDPSIDPEHDKDSVLNDFQLFELEDAAPWSVIMSYYGDDLQRDILAPPKVRLMLDSMFAFLLHAYSIWLINRCI